VSVAKGGGGGGGGGGGVDVCVDGGHRQRGDCVIDTSVCNQCIAAGNDVVAAHNELRTRLTYEVGVIIAQKERKAERERRRQQHESSLKYSPSSLPGPLHLTESHSANQIHVAVPVDSSTVAGPAHDDDVLEYAGADDGGADVGGDVGSDDDYEDARAHVDVHGDVEHIASQRSAAAAEVAAADASSLHWGKIWVKAAATAEKGDKL
jgi:hypothetical protein